MPRCNLTLKQKTQIIELRHSLPTELLARKFRVHPTTITRIIKNQAKILDQAGRVNSSFKTVQTYGRCQEHDLLVLEYIKQKQQSKEPVSIQDICDRALEFAQLVDRPIKSKRSWWRRFKTRCQIVRSRLQDKNSKNVANTMEHPLVSSQRSYQIPNKGATKVYTFKVKDPTLGSIPNHINTQ